MQGKAARIFCQRCLAANAMGQESCARCGTRLMIVVEPGALRYEDEGAISLEHDEHMLERVSALENRLVRLAERVERGLELLLRQTRNTFFDHALLETLVGILCEARAIDRTQLEASWRARCEREVDEDAPEGRQVDTLPARIVAACEAEGRELFARIVNDGFDLLRGGESVRGIRALERAAGLDPRNAPLHSFLGEHFFRAGRMALAQEYLARSLAAEPEDDRVRLLLGLAYGDEGKAARAKKLLSETVRRGRPSFAAHYGLGRLLAAEAKWKAALSEFNRALAARPSPEAHYVLGVVYYKLERLPMSLKHLERAIEMDREYAEAFYLLGLVLLRMGERGRAFESFDAAHTLDRAEPRFRAALKLGERSRQLPPPPPLLNSPPRGKKRLVTGGDSRLAAALRADALGAALAR